MAFFTQNFLGASLLAYAQSPIESEPATPDAEMETDELTTDELQSILQSMGNTPCLSTLEKIEKNNLRNEFIEWLELYDPTYEESWIESFIDAYVFLFPFKKFYGILTSTSISTLRGFLSSMRFTLTVIHTVTDESNKSPILRGIDTFLKAEIERIDKSILTDQLESLRRDLKKQDDKDKKSEEVAPEEVAPEEVAPEEVAPEEVAPEEVAPEEVIEEEVIEEEVIEEEVIEEEVIEEEVIEEEVIEEEVIEEEVIEEEVIEEEVIEEEVIEEEVIEEEVIEEEVIEEEVIEEEVIEEEVIEEEVIEEEVIEEEVIEEEVIEEEVAPEEVIEEEVIEEEVIEEEVAPEEVVEEEVAPEEVIEEEVIEEEVIEEEVIEEEVIEEEVAPEEVIEEEVIEEENLVNPYFALLDSILNKTVLLNKLRAIDDAHQCLSVLYYVAYNPDYEKHKDWLKDYLDEVKAESEQLSILSADLFPEKVYSDSDLFIPLVDLSNDEGKDVKLTYEWQERQYDYNDFYQFSYLQNLTTKKTEEYVPEINTDDETYQNETAEGAPIGFPFTFYGTDYDKVFISPLGYVGFEETAMKMDVLTDETSALITPLNIPTEWEINEETALIETQTFGESPNRSFTIKWEEEFFLPLEEELEEGEEEITEETVEEIESEEKVVDEEVEQQGVPLDDDEEAEEEEEDPREVQTLSMQVRFFEEDDSILFYYEEIPSSLEKDLLKLGLQDSANSQFVGNPIELRYKKVIPNKTTVLLRPKARFTSMKYDSLPNIDAFRLIPGWAYRAVITPSTKYFTGDPYYTESVIVSKEESPKMLDSENTLAFEDLVALPDGDWTIFDSAKFEVYPIEGYKGRVKKSVHDQILYSKNSITIDKEVAEARGVNRSETYVYIKILKPFTEKYSDFQIDLEDHWAQVGNNLVETETYGDYKYIILPMPLADFEKTEERDYKISFDLFLNLYANSPPGVYNIEVAYTLQ